MKNLSPQKASVLSLQRILSLGGQAGVIVLNKHGRFAIMHTTNYMVSGYANNKGIVVQQGSKRVSKE
jgi:isoaspartyl peptidase/L-asparaginase-like protein (Ntn-hydrolase superfamily)